MSFLYPYALIGLILPVILGVAGYILHLRRKGNWEQLVAATHKKNLVRTTSPLHSVVPTILALLALACCIIATARPFNGYKNTEATFTGRNLLIALDISRSMETQDVEPSRLEEARTAARVLIDSLPTDKIGLIIFSGESELTIPLTYDHLTLQETINLVNRDWESYGGSNLAEVLKLAMQTFERSDANGTNALVILSDGEDTVNFPTELLDEAREKNLLLIVVGIGTTEGATIPDAQSETGMWQDENGKHVISKLQTETLSMMARETGGDFFIMNNSTDLAAFAKAAVEKIDRHEETQSAGKSPNDMYGYFAGAALLLIIPAILLATNWRNMPKNLSRHRAGILLVLIFICSQVVYASPSDESVQAYRQAAAYQREGKHQECADELSKALLDADPHMQAAALHHLGNLRTQTTFTALKNLYQDAQGQAKQPTIEELETIVSQLEQDSEYYKNAVALHSAMAPASTNLQRVTALVERIKEEIERLKQQQKENEQQQNNQQKQDEQKDQQQDNQDNQQKQDEQKDQQKQDNQDDQQKQDEQKDQQQDNQDDQQKKDEQKDQQPQENKDDQQKQDKPKDQQKQDQKKDQQQQQQSQNEQQKEKKQEKSEQSDQERRIQRQKQRARDLLNMNRDEENEAQARKQRLQYEYNNHRRRPNKDY